MSFAAWTKNLAAMADRIGAIRRKICDAAEEQERQARILEFDKWRPIDLGLDFYFRSRPTFQYIGGDSWYWVQGRRVVSGEERARIIREYFKKQAAVRLFDERRNTGGE